MTTPHWLQAHATRTGNDPTLTGTRARPRWCRTCRRLVLAGYDAPLAAGLAITDPHPLTPQLETAAVLLARPTYRLWGTTPDTYELTPRTPTYPPHIPLPPASPTVIVLTAHNCDRPPLTHAPLPTPHRHTVDHDAPPPF